MTDTPPKPKRRRWRWLAVLLTLGAVSLGITFWNNHVSSLTHAWLLEASQGTPLVIEYDTVGMIPGFEDNEVIRRVLGRRQITVVVFREEDAEKLFSMPPCPVKLIIATLARTPPDVVTRLRERFGDAVQ